MAAGGHPRRPENKIQEKKVTKKSTDFCFGTRHRFFFFPLGHIAQEKDDTSPKMDELSRYLSRAIHTHTDGGTGKEGARTLCRAINNAEKLLFYFFIFRNFDFLPGGGNQKKSK
jgi:hypothetical protein